MDIISKLFIKRIADAMIVGNGQLAHVFKDVNMPDTVIFASGVSDSNCIDKNEFKREKDLLVNTIRANKDKKFIYFSSCALSAKEYPKNEYYKHKAEMEEIIKLISSSYYIFRLPQLFGRLKEHKTLINFIYKSILNDIEFNLYNEAYRYVIEINDVKLLVQSYLESTDTCITIDLANFHRYRVEDIVNIFENLLDKKANYILINKRDEYYLDLQKLHSFMDTHNINILFGREYLYNRLNEKIINV